MRYGTLWAMSQDEDLQHRLIACAALEERPQPEWWVRLRLWDIVARSDWIEAYAYALTAGVERPGNDAGVITDGMILSSVQAVA